jgi:hypothetical protein
VEQLLENTLNDHSVKLEKSESDIKDLDIKVQTDLGNLDKTLNEKVLELDNNLNLTDDKFSNLLDEKTKDINEVESKLKADYDFKFEEYSKNQVTLEDRLNQTETKLNNTETILDNNNEYLLQKLKEAEDKNLEAEDKISELNDKIISLENIDIDEKIENADSVKGLKDYLETLNNDFISIKDQVTSYETILDESSTPSTSSTSFITDTLTDAEDIEICTEEDIENLNKAITDIEGLNTKLDDLTNVVNSITIPEVYDDSEIKTLISNEEKRALSKEDDLELEIMEVKSQIESIIEGSTLDLNSFAEIIDYINSIDVENKDITDLITANETRLSSLELKTESLTQVLDELNTIKENLISVEDSNSKLSTDLNNLRIDSITRTDVLTDSVSEINTKIIDLDTTISNLSNVSSDVTISEYDDSELKEKIEDEEKRAKDKEELLDSKIEDEIKRSTDKENELENNFNDVLTGRKIVAKATDANTLNSKAITDLVLKSDYVGLAPDGKALEISGNTLSLTNSNGFIETIDLPVNESTESSFSLPELRTENNTLRSSQYITVNNTEWQNMRSVILDAGIYNFNISTENYVNDWRANYYDVDEFIGQALVLPQGEFDSYGSLTPSTYLDDAYKSKDTNMFNLMDCTQGNYNNTSGQIILKERQEVRIFLRSLITSETTFLIKAQLYKLQ